MGLQPRAVSVGDKRGERWLVHEQHMQQIDAERAAAQRTQQPPAPRLRLFLPQQLAGGEIKGKGQKRRKAGKESLRSGFGADAALLRSAGSEQRTDRNTGQAAQPQQGDAPAGELRLLQPMFGKVAEAGVKTACSSSQPRLRPQVGACSFQSHTLSVGSSP